MLARQAQAQVVPVVIDGEFKVFHRMHIIVGKPVEMDLNEEGRPSVVLKNMQASAETGSMSCVIPTV